jgi:hypothetical protein
MPKETAKILVQNPEMRNQISRPIRKYKPSRTAMYDASPTVNAGSRMCQAITQAHCKRDSKRDRASWSNTLVCPPENIL